MFGKLYGVLERVGLFFVFIRYRIIREDILGVVSFDAWVWSRVRFG